MNLSRARAASLALTAAVSSICCLAVTPLAAQNKPKAKTSIKGSSISRRLTRGEYVAKKALSFRGVPYQFGGRSRNGVDCSGLIQTVCKHYGLYVPRTSIAQYKSGLPVPKPQIKAGDLVFFKNTYKRGISHVGIYVGDGKFVHAANQRKGVIVSALAEPYWANRWAGARRVAIEGLSASH